MSHKIRAFTLVELIVVLVLVGIVIQMGYSMLLYGNNTFNLSTSRGLSQQNVRLAETVLSDELKYIRDISTSEDGFVTNYYSLKYENGEIIKSHHVFNEATSTVDVSVISKVSGDWNKLIIKNTASGEINLTIGQGELVGNKTSPYELAFKVFTINNSSLLSNLDVDLTSSGTVIYYQQMYDFMSEQASAMSVDIKDLSTGGSGSTTNVTLSFIVDGAEDLSRKVTAVQGSKVTLPIGPSKSGYNFLHWNTKEDGSGNMYPDNAEITVPNSDTNLYAQWTTSTNNPVVTSVKIIKIGTQTVDISKNNSTRVAIEKGVNHTMTVQILGMNLKTGNISIKVMNTNVVNFIVNEENNISFNFILEAHSGNDKVHDVEVIINNSKNEQLTSADFHFITQ